MQEPNLKDPKDPHANQPEQFSGNKRQANPDQPAQQDHDPDQQPAGNDYGEGNYKAAREYQDATRDFIRSGRAAGAARDAEPRTAQEAQEMAEAEAQGRVRSKGEDPSAPPAAKKRKRKSKH